MTFIFHEWITGCNYFGLTQFSPRHINISKKKCGLGYNYSYVRVRLSTEMSDQRKHTPATTLVTKLKTIFTILQYIVNK